MMRPLRPTRQQSNQRLKIAPYPMIKNPPFPSRPHPSSSPPPTNHFPPPPPLLPSSFLPSPSYLAVLPPPRGLHYLFFTTPFTFLHARTRSTTSSSPIGRPEGPLFYVQLHERVVSRVSRYPSIAQSIDRLVSLITPPPILILVHILPPLPPPQCALPFPLLLSP